jgi:ribosomal protein S18 acetylase RimI-like enzyme
VDVRPAGKSDLEAIARVARVAWSETYRGLLEADTITDVVSADYSPHALAFRLASRSILVADDGGNICGFAECRVEGDHIALAGLYVDPSHRHRGIGSALLHAARRLAPHLPVCADVLLGNMAGEAFYETRGFVPGETFEGTLADEPVVERRWWLANERSEGATIVPIRG